MKPLLQTTLLLLLCTALCSALLACSEDIQDDDFQGQTTSATTGTTQQTTNTTPSTSTTATTSSTTSTEDAGTDTDVADTTEDSSQEDDAHTTPDAEPDTAIEPTEEETAYCDCVFLYCHDLYHEVWGDDELVARNTCFEQARSTPRAGSPQTSGDSFECRQHFCTQVAEDPSLCPAALGIDTCVE